MKSVPRIGLTTLFKENPGVAGDWYVRPHKYDLAVVEAGGLPLSIPAFADDKLLEQYMEMLDGMLFIGGPDIPPHLYGGEPHPKICPLEENVARNHLKLVRMAFRRSIPVVGICLGMQELNAAGGGAIIPDLGDLVPYHKRSGGDQYHQAVLEPDSRLAEIFGCRELRVNSCHHQAVDPEKLASGAKITASCGEVVEAIEFPGPVFRIGLQWHPERIDDDAHRKKIFGAFLSACREA